MRAWAPKRGHNTTSSPPALAYHLRFICVAAPRVSKTAHCPLPPTPHLFLHTRLERHKLLPADVFFHAHAAFTKLGLEDALCVDVALGGAGRRRLCQRLNGLEVPLCPR